MLNFENINENEFKVSSSDTMKIYTESRDNLPVNLKGEIVGSPTIVSLNEKSNIATNLIANEQNQNSPADVLNLDAKEVKISKKDSLKHRSKSISSPQYKVVSHETLNLNDNNACTVNNETLFSATNQQVNESNAELGFVTTNEKAENKSKNIKVISGQVHGGPNASLVSNSAVMIPKSNAVSSKLFKPILNFIGIDAPSGTLMDNLFKEFGSLISGNLHIKSVDINILGKQTGTHFSSNFNAPFSNVQTNDASKPPRSEPVKLRSFYSSKKSHFFNTNSASFDKDKNDQNRVITTILSFDSLLFNLNIRQEFRPPLNKSVRLNDEKTEADSTFKSGAKSKNEFSMSNPLYFINENETSPTSNVYEPKYYTKIDTGNFENAYLKFLLVSKRV